MNQTVSAVRETSSVFSEKDRAIMDAHFKAIHFLHRRCGNTFAVSRTLVLLYVALMNMSDKPVYLKNIADMLGICMPAASRMIVKLLAPDVTSQLGYGLIEQIPDYLDRRRSRLQLTPKGTELIASYLAKVRHATEHDE